MHLKHNNNLKKFEGTPNNGELRIQFPDEKSYFLS